jgi:hypothetical protein
VSAAPGTPTRYVALGDSFTAGAAGSGAPSFGDRLAAHPRAVIGVRLGIHLDTQEAI